MSRSAVIGVVFALLSGIFVYLVYLNFFAPSPERTPPGVAGLGSSVDAGSGSPAAPAPAAVGASGAEPRVGMMPVVLFFQGPDVDLLFTEERRVPSSEDGNLRARTVLEELARGPTRELLPTLPEGTRVREVYFDSTGVAYVDFSAELRDNHPGGSAEELMTIDSIVNTLARNVPQVQAVRLLVDGREVPTLAGHVDLAGPLLPSDDRLAPQTTP